MMTVAYITMAIGLLVFMFWGCALVVPGWPHRITDQKPVTVYIIGWIAALLVLLSLGMMGSVALAWLMLR